MISNSKLGEAAKHSIIYGLGSVAQSALAFILLPILTGKLSPNDFGAYSLLAMISTVASAIFYLGMTSALTRSYFDYPEGEERRAVFTTAFVILLMGALLQTLLGYIAGAFISNLFFHNSTYGEAVMWALLSGSCTFINQYFFTYLRLIRKSLATIGFSIISIVLGLSMTIWMLQLYPKDITVPFKAIIYSQLIITIAFLIIYGRSALIWRMHKKEMSPLLHYGAALTFASFGGMLLDWSDRLIIERYLTLADVGVYSATVRVSGLIGVLLITPFTQIWTPMMMEYRYENKIKELFTSVFSYYFIVGGLTLCMAALFSKELLSLLIQYEISFKSILVFTLLSMASLIYGVTNIVIAGIFYERKVYLLPFIYYFLAIIKIFLNLLIIPLYGIIAAATSTLLASILLPVSTYMLAKRYFSFEIEWARIIKITAIVFIFTAYALSIVSMKLNPVHWIARLIGAPILLLIIGFYCLNSYERSNLIFILKKISTKIKKNINRIKK
jgi:O-antigen/teichoic acid export membrane protein